jgi:hypothetical protein
MPHPSESRSEPHFDTALKLERAAKREATDENPAEVPPRAHFWMHCRPFRFGLVESKNDYS